MRKTQVFLLIGVLALAGCANNPYASNGTTADTGGGALLRNFDRLLMRETGMPVHIGEDPLLCVAKGTGRCLDDRAILEKIKKLQREG